MLIHPTTNGLNGAAFRAGSIKALSSSIASGFASKAGACDEFIGTSAKNTKDSLKTLWHKTGSLCELASKNKDMIAKAGLAGAGVAAFVLAIAGVSKVANTTVSDDDIVIY